MGVRDLLRQWSEPWLDRILPAVRLCIGTAQRVGDSGLLYGALFRLAEDGSNSDVIWVDDNTIFDGRLSPGIKEISDCDANAFVNLTHSWRTLRPEGFSHRSWDACLRQAGCCSASEKSSALSMIGALDQDRSGRQSQEKMGNAERGRKNYEKNNSAIPGQMKEQLRLRLLEAPAPSTGPGIELGSEIVRIRGVNYGTSEVYRYG